ncbi:3' terminal RNA ribose 2'-O-methyltransferase Hen1 [Telmatocola sphagniphila]|uniref:Small RNA 2'-O-methyltransferase n=1 Tax=Telmatocola sphagniphila TaxID=1123043 RepID=A0A8E6EY85_9BACT|nr:3' terminal RNA ribose 2'-O-methyltransferase Hen1 [Telmatocola sphagniphila]QVL32423.1 3' terminal RNA ribose 2'-O-methyltransferase Hen1 [Telmatocola sphagniphila]
MFLTISTSHSPATDLGYLLHKKPGRLQSFSLNFGQLHVFYTEASEEKCTAVLLLDMDAVGWTRSRPDKRGEAGLLYQYVNDRPYVASSFLSVAISQVLGSALNGRCKDRPELAETPIPLTVSIPVLPSRGGEGFLRKLFEPLGYQLELRRHPLDQNFTEWGESRYFFLKLSKTVVLHELLSHLYVLIPVLDADKHYWIGEEEVAKLLKHGEGWLETHPEKAAIVDRYLKYRGNLVQAAHAGLLVASEELPADSDRVEIEDEVETKIRLHDLRQNRVCEVLVAEGCRSVVDLGCGEGKLLTRLCQEKQFEKIIGVDVSTRSLEIADQKLRRRGAYDEPDRLKLLQGSAVYRDDRLAGFDGLSLVEVVEHLDLNRLPALEKNIFAILKPRVVVLTTPNREYNVKFEGLKEGKLRHRDHRFEWTRSEFQNWATAIGQKYGYAVQIEMLGELDAELGGPSQLGVFIRS